MKALNFILAASIFATYPTIAWAWDISECQTIVAQDGLVLGAVEYGPNGFNVEIRDPNWQNNIVGFCSIAYDFTAPDVPVIIPPRGPRSVCGSVIRVDNLDAGENIPLVGTSDFLTYVSSRDSARTAEYTINLPISTTPYNSNLSSIDVNISIAGQTNSFSFPIMSDGMYFNYTWDGLNNSMAELRASAELSVDVHQNYVASGVPDIPFKYVFKVGGYKAKHLGLGGLNISSVHFYDSIRKATYLGDGEMRDGEARQVTMDSSGYITDVTPATTFDYFMIVEQAMGEAYLFNSAGLHVQTRSTLTGELLKAIAYDGSARIISITDAFGNVISVGRPSSTSVTITAPRGQVTTLTLNGSGRVTNIEDPMSNDYSLTYNSAGLLSAFQNPGGAISTFTYDSAGLLTNDSHNAGAALDFWQVIASTSNRDIHMTTAEGRESVFSTSFSGSAYSRLESRPSGGTASYHYVPGSSMSYAEPDGTTVSEAFNSDPRFAMQAPYFGYLRQSGSQATSLTVSRSSSFSASNLLALTSETDTKTLDSKTWTRIYLGGSTRLEQLSSPLGRTLKQKRNLYNQIIESQNSTFAPVTYGYDSYGRLTTLTQGSRTTTLTYDSSGWVSQTQDPISKVTQFTYDANGNVLTQTLPDSRVLTFTYDANGNNTSIVTAASNTHSFGYNLFDIFASYTAPVVSSTSFVTNYTYNNDKQLTQITRPDSSVISLNYNAIKGLLDTMTTPDGDYSYLYNYPGQITQISSPLGVDNTYAYDGELVATAATIWTGVNADVTYTRNNFLIASSVVRGTNNATNSIAYTYNNDRLMTAAGNLTISRTASTGLVSGTTVNNVSEIYTYDSTYGELASYQAKYSGSQIYKEDYTRNARGQITQRVVVDGATTTTFDYVYDDASRLHQVYVNTSLARTYNYDANSNLSSLVAGSTLTGTYDDQDRLLSYGPYAFTHNMLGQRTGRTESGSLTAFNYSYDGLGAMKGFTKTYASGGGTITDTYTYLNDARGNRVQIKKGTTTLKRFIYDERNRLIAELNNSGNILTRFVYATRDHVPDYLIKSGTRYKIIHDHLGSVIKVINTGTGAVASSFSYDEFGKILTSSVPDFQPFGWAGGLKDDVTGLVRFGARDYDPETGRWTSKDPVLFNGSDTNLYGYTFNDPVNFVDPNGLWAIVIGGGFSGVIGGGTEGSGGVYFGTDRGGRFSAGTFFTGGGGFGVSAGADVFAGYFGSTSDIPGGTNNLNGGIGFFSGSLFFSDPNGSPIGGTIGFGPSLPYGGSVSHTETSTCEMYGK